MNRKEDEDKKEDEKKTDDKNEKSVDKNEIKEISVPNGEVTEGVAFYVLNVKTHGGEEWSCMKRYSMFEELSTNLQNDSCGRRIPTGLELPPKKIKLFVSHVSPQFIEDRRCLLENYLKRLMKISEIANSQPIKDFMTEDKQTEKKDDKEKVELPPDVEITGITIPTTRTMSDHILYQIDVVNARKRKTFSKWTVLKRFGQFYEMDTAVRVSLEDKPAILETLPPAPQRKAKLIVDHMDDTFVEQRRVLLENYLKLMLSCDAVIRNREFLNFLGVS